MKEELREYKKRLIEQNKKRIIIINDKGLSEEDLIKEHFEGRDVSNENINILIFNI